jgi:hypothetical protein
MAAGTAAVNHRGEIICARALAAAITANQLGIPWRGSEKPSPAFFWCRSWRQSRNNAVRSVEVPQTGTAASCCDLGD